MNRILSHFGANFRTSHKATERVNNQKIGPISPASRYDMPPILSD